MDPIQFFCSHRLHMPNVFDTVKCCGVMRERETGGKKRYRRRFFFCSPFSFFLS